MSFTFKKFIFIVILVFILGLPIELYNLYVWEFPGWAKSVSGLILGTVSFIFLVRYDKRHPDLIDSLPFWDMPVHTIKAILMIDHHK